jgi:hypothetical protein
LEVVLAAGRAFAEEVADVPRPAFLDRRESAWAVADRVAWGEAPPPATAPASVAWSLAVAAVDAVVWEGADAGVLDVHDPQIVLRALLFRLVTDAIVGADTASSSRPVAHRLLARCS